MSEVKPIQKSSIVRLPAEKPELYKKPVFHITVCALIILIGLSVITLGLTGLIPLLPGMISGGVLAAGALVGLTVCLFKCHKDKKRRAGIEIIGR